MTDTQIDPKQNIRLWPGVALLVIQWFMRFGLPAISPDFAMIGMMGGIFIVGITITLWWLFFSRLPWSERLGGLGLAVAAVLVTPLFLHESIKTGGMGMMFIIFVIPVLCMALVSWGVLSKHLLGVPRYAALVAFVLVATGMWTLLRTEGATGQFEQDFAWRWSETTEQKLLAADQETPVAPPTTEVAEEVPIKWSGFLGADRNNVVRGIQVETDWNQSPPQEMWRKPIGPGWSSFSVRGDLFYTQEQRGEQEVVSCYKVSTGDLVWRHQDEDRFWESIGGAGPRSTPTLVGDRVYTIGGNGLVNALNANDGKVIWSGNAVKDTGVEIPGWGISGSPLVYGDLVIAPAAGTLIAYDANTGEQRWMSPSNGTGYSSPRLLEIQGVPQVLFLNGDGLNSFNPADGKLLWQHEWSGEPVVVPQLASNGDLLIHSSAMSGIRRLSVTGGPDNWDIKELWTSNRLKPYYSEFMVHNDNAFGFDGAILACVDLAEGERKWKGGRYGAGQMFLLADQGLLLVLSEKGDLALVEAGSDGFNELSRFKALKGKTWNHPVLVGDTLLVRNAKEMAAFKLALKSGT